MMMSPCPRGDLALTVCPGAACAAAPAGDEVKMSRQRMLAVPYARHAANGVPSGTIMPYGGEATISGSSNIPAGWVLCDGKGFDGTSQTYQRLYQRLQVSWGDGSANCAAGNCNFNVPDLRGKFLRGAQVGRAVGHHQAWSTGKPKVDFTTAKQSNDHDHGYVDENLNQAGANSVGWSNDGWTDLPYNKTTAKQNQDHTHTVTAGGDSETRPDNYGVNYIIKI
jgi:microcystin-dependent protein